MPADESALWLIDKPEGWTSHDVVRAVRRRLGMRRVGHTGTLDPFATGLLLVLVGRATRLTEYFHPLPKRYRAGVRFGATSDTLDPTGRIEPVAGASLPPPDAVRSAVEALPGRHDQVPPAFSAKRVAGERAHRLARAGEAVELEPVEIEVYASRLAGLDGPDATIEVSVSTGTYVRALARDLGRSLGTGAYLTSLVRTGIGSFDRGEAVPPDADDSDWRSARRSPLDALSWLPRRDLTGEEREHVLAGRAIDLGELEPMAGESAAPVVLRQGDRLVAIAELRSGRLAPRKVLAAR